MTRRKKPQNRSAKPANNTLRIIGGQWRSRKLTFLDAPNLRPTPDRVRETLFNWLQADIHGARCLDLFAGSGALGLEALSRGASEVIFVESVQHVAKQLEANLALLQSDAPVVLDDAQHYLQQRYLQQHQQALKNEPFDIVFLDPPFRKNLLKPVVETILEKKLLAVTGLIYLEQEAEERIDWQEFGLNILKETQAGQVKSFLLEVVGD